MRAKAFTPMLRQAQYNPKCIYIKKINLPNTHGDNTNKGGGMGENTSKKSTV